jgi:preprotein translocase subunit SecA
MRQAEWHSLDETEHGLRLHQLRARLAHEGWAGDAQADALGCVAAACQHTLARNPFDTQLQAAVVLLADQFAEMATGEGKTLAAGLAAAVAALAGVPVHVMTANDYLAGRDAAQLAPLFAKLGLRVGTVVGPSTPAERRAAYACDITYATAREVAFDYLRDGLATIHPGDELKQRARSLIDTPPAPPLLRGLCMALLDEADSLLIDDASLPLILSESHDDAQQRAACFQALAIARQLVRQQHFDIDAGDRIVFLQPGHDHVDQLCATLGGAWHNRQHRHDLLNAALVALHVLQRDRHYLVREGRVDLLDAQTGRAAPGRVWSNGLQTLVELKEGCVPSPATTTRAQISFQRFFARYVRLCGMSGTLAECRRELAAVCGRRVVAVAPRRPSLRLLGPDRWYADAAWRRSAIVQRVAELHATGRPVLVGTDSVAESEALAALLAQVGIPHRVLNARHDAAEAQIVSAAGQRGAVTVATQMAGRGTDIALGDGVAALGGLHVLCALDSLSPRLVRQLVGRCARQGDPGSAETWHQRGAPAWADRAGSSVLLGGRKPDEHGRLRVSAVLLQRWAAWLGGLDEGRAARQRQRLLEQDREWQRQLDFSTPRA